MQDFCEFLVEYWKPIFGISLCTLSVLITLLRKRPKADSVLDYIYQIISENLTDYVLAAEKKYTDGYSKLLYVVDCCMADLSHRVTLDANSTAKARSAFIYAVERVLETPQKKV